MRSENEQLRAVTQSIQQENAKLRSEKHFMEQVSEKLARFKLSEGAHGGSDLPMEPPTWPPPKSKPQVIVYTK